MMSDKSALMASSLQNTAMEVSANSSNAALLLSRLQQNHCVSNPLALSHHASCTSSTMYNASNVRSHLHLYTIALAQDRMRMLNMQQFNPTPNASGMATSGAAAAAAPSTAAAAAAAAAAASTAAATSSSTRQAAMTSAMTCATSSSMTSSMSASSMSALLPPPPSFTGDLLTHPYFSSKFDPRLFRIGPSCLDEPKPQHSYIGLIAMAILSSGIEQRLVLADIYQYILDHFPYFRHRGPGWRNSIRHNLSLNECFIKAGRAANGKGNFWAIHPACVDDFRRGDFRRRRAQRKVRRHNGHHVDEDDSPSPPPPPFFSVQPQSVGTQQSQQGGQQPHVGQQGRGGPPPHAGQPVVQQPSPFLAAACWPLIAARNLAAAAATPTSTAVTPPATAVTPPSTATANVGPLRRKFDVASLLGVVNSSHSLEKEGGGNNNNEKEEEEEEEVEEPMEKADVSSTHIVSSTNTANPNLLFPWLGSPMSALMPGNDARLAHEYLTRYYTHLLAANGGGNAEPKTPDNDEDSNNNNNREEENNEDNVGNLDDEEDIECDK